MRYQYPKPSPAHFLQAHRQVRDQGALLPTGKPQSPQSAGRSHILYDPRRLSRSLSPSLKNRILSATRAPCQTRHPLAVPTEAQLSGLAGAPIVVSNRTSPTAKLLESCLSHGQIRLCFVFAPYVARCGRASHSSSCSLWSPSSAFSLVYFCPPSPGQKRAAAWLTAKGTCANSRWAL